MKYQKAAPELRELGWSPIPVVPGHKRPAIKSWSHYCAELPFEHEVISMSINYPDHSIGLCCGAASGIWALDLDADDALDAARIGTLADKFLGTTPLVRVGRPPRSLRVYRSDTIVKSDKGQSLDVLGAGRQFVAFGIHEKTGLPYEWIDESPLNFEAKALPTTTEEALRAFMDALKGELGTTHRQEGKSSQQRPVYNCGVSDLAAQRRGKRGQSRYQVLRNQLKAAQPGQLHNTMVSVVADLVIMKLSPDDIHNFFQRNFAAPKNGEYAEVWRQIDPAIRGAQKKWIH